MEEAQCYEIKQTLQHLKVLSSLRALNRFDQVLKNDIFHIFRNFTMVSLGLYCCYSVL